MTARSAFLIVALLSGLVDRAHAAWPNHPAVNLPIGVGTASQRWSAILSDGDGGAYVVWGDDRPGLEDLYVQHILASGAFDPAWPAGGLAVCTAPGFQFLPWLVSDGAGGVIIAWNDLRAGGPHEDIYAHHVTPSGLDPAWPVNGTLLCSVPEEQLLNSIVSDGAGGAIVAWRDSRAVTSYDVYAQRVLSNGVVAVGWPANGRVVANAGAYDEWEPVLAPDGGGGALVVWLDRRTGWYDVYAQHVLASGNLDPAWPISGLAIATTVGDKTGLRTVPDGSGGAVVAWSDPRGGFGADDVYAHHVLGSGVVDLTWPANGRAIVTAGGAQLLPAMISDGAGGAIVAWQDGRGATNDIYAQHLQASGVVNPSWPVNGRALCTATGFQGEVQLVTDGAGGAIAAWQDQRASSFHDLYAQRVTSAGTVDPAYPAEGRALSTAANYQLLPRLASDEAGGAIVSWDDLRAGNYDVYAQRIARFGYLGTPEPEIASVLDVTNDEGGRVKVSWNASYLDAIHDPNLVAYDIYRSVPASLARARLAAGARAKALGAEPTHAGELVVMALSATTYYWELVGTTAAVHFPSGYSFLAPTAQDSVPGDNPVTVFTVVARNGSYSMYWPSQPDSGYSVDDLSPATPAPFAGSYWAGTTHLEWGANTESDLAGYRLYRGSSAGFVPDPGSLIATPDEPGYDDAGASGAYYKLTAIDVHGNESSPALLAPSATLEVGADSSSIAFLPPQPNPGRERVTLAYRLPRASRVELTVFDAAGRRVRALASGTRAAGEHRSIWDLRNESGERVRSGSYFAHLKVAGSVWRTRLTVLR